jgi:hypothetical protein
MTKSSLWAIYCQKNPQFAEDGEITLTTKGLRKMFDVTWDTAFYDGEEEPCAPKEHGSPSVNALMEIFGMKP